LGVFQAESVLGAIRANSDQIVHEPHFPKNENPDGDRWCCVDAGASGMLRAEFSEPFTIYRF